MKTTSMDEYEKYYREVEWPRVLASIAEWEKEFSQGYRDSLRKEYLCDLIEPLEKEYYDCCVALASRDDDLTYWSEKYISVLWERLNSLQAKERVVTQHLEGIDRTAIENALRYPIDRLIKVSRGMALCPFHNDRNPSMDVRKNFYYCYTCQAHGSVIDLVMKRDGKTFKEAVQSLQ